MNRNDFLTDIAFERFALREFCHQPGQTSGPLVIDLRGPNRRLSSSVTSIAFASDSGRLRSAMASLAFGAAWKVIDLMIEHALIAVAPPSRGRVTIKSKADFATNNRSDLLVAVPHADLVTRLAELYRATVDLRHALTHRSVTYQGDLLSDGTTSMSLDSIDAFAHVALSTADIVASSVGTIDQRTFLDIAHWLNLLGALHGQSPIPNAQPRREIPLVLVAAQQRDDGAWVVNTKSAMAGAMGVLSTARWFDAEIHFPDASHAPLRIQLDAAPVDDAVVVTPGSPPGWIRP